MLPDYMNESPDGQISCMLSPMAGFTNAPMRLACLRRGARQAHTEMASATALVCEKADAAWILLETLPEEGKIVAHLYGAVPDDFARAAEKIAATERFCAIDINAGCPSAKVTEGGAGAALMRRPELVGQIVSAVRRASGLPVSVKTRTGFSPLEITVFRVLDAAQEAGASLLTVHGRFLRQRHSGEVEYDILAQLKARAGIPVLGNGGVRDRAGALEFVRKTGVDGLLIGQGAIGSPWIFEDIVRDGGDQEARSIDAIRTALFAHIDAELEFARHLARKYPQATPNAPPETVAAIRFRLSLFRYLSGLRGVAYARGRMADTWTIDEVKRVADGCFECERRFRGRVGRT